VVLLFYPGDNTPVCTRQFCSYRDSAEDMGSLQATVVGISAQDVESHSSFTAKHGLTVDEGGIVRHRHDHALGLDFQDAGELREALRGLDDPGLATPR